MLPSTIRGRALIGILMLLAAHFSLGQDIPLDPEAVRWFREGEALIDTAEAYSARQAECFRKAIEIEPAFTAARFNLALIHLRNGDHVAAREQLDELVLLEPEEPRAYLLRAELSLRQADIEPAERDIERLLTLSPKDSQGLHYLGKIRLQQNRPQEALARLQEASAHGLQEPTLAFDLALALQQTGQLSEAARQYRNFLEAYPDDFDAHYGLGLILRELEQTESALEHLRTAEKLRPNDAEVALQLGYLYLDLGDLDEAEKRLRGAGSSATDLANRGVIALKEGRFIDAEFQFRRALVQDPENGQIHAHLGDLYYRRNDAEAAIRSYTRALELGVDDRDLRLNLGTVLANLNRDQEAARHLEQAVAFDPESPDAHHFLGVVFDRLLNSDKAIAHYRRAIDLGVQEGQVYYRLALLLARDAQAEEALKNLSAALEADPDRYLTLVKRELLQVHSDLDSIRYSASFSELLAKYRQGSEEPR